MVSDALSRMDEDYEGFYEAEIAPKLQSLESRRQTTVRGIYALGGLAVLGLAVALLHEDLAGRLDINKDVLAVGGMLVLIGGVGAAMVIYGRMREAVKKALVAPTCAFLGLDYSLKGDGFPLERFDEGGILPKYDKSTLRDRITGHYEGVDFELCDTLLEARRKSNNEKGSNTNYDRVFEGLLLIYRFPKSFRGRTVVVPDRSWLGNKLTGMKHGERVVLEDPRFEELYAAYSDDQVEARYLLTPTFMERLTELADHLKARKSLAFAFQDSDLLIAFDSKVGHFEGGSLFKPLEDRGRVKELTDELRLVYDLVHRLNLTNTTGV